MTRVWTSPGASCQGLGVRINGRIESAELVVHRTDVLIEPR